MLIKSDGLIVGISEDMTRINRLCLGKRELSSDSAPLFSMRLRNREGEPLLLDAAMAKRSAEINGSEITLRYSFSGLDAAVSIRAEKSVTWSLSVRNRTDLAVEYIDFPSLSVSGRLRRNGGDAAIVSTYNEGLLVEDGRLKRGMDDPEYPSLGGSMMFPYMLSAQFMLYLAGDDGLYMGVHDADRAPKGLDFRCQENSCDFRVRLFMGGGYGEDVTTPDIVWKHFSGDWQDAADIYREWLEESFSAKPIADTSLPDWYKTDMPLVLTYPVRGIHDMDKMDPNKLFPYENALPYIDEFASKTGMRILVLLMHWEGTAPWAPPFVWPPFGGVDMFDAFMKKLHADGNLLGVYCSGLGFTEQSNLIDSYNNEKMISDNHLTDCFCAGPDQKVLHSRICTGQRSGYDICPASEAGRKILNDALEPLLLSGIDYVQALDQNHGGGMYFCYSQSHGHPPVPGKWMTEASRKLLDGWRQKNASTLLGCESAAAEPYIEELRLSDNRYELCYRYGRPIPVYAYLFHRYVKNFMGNQVSCPLAYTTELCELRLAYSFLAGDLLTLVINDDGDIMFHWGMRDFTKKPDRDELITFISTLHRWHKIYPEIFRDAEMRKPLKLTCGESKLEMRYGSPVYESNVLTSAWKNGEKTVQFLVNWTHTPQICSIEPVKKAVIRRENSVESLLDGEMILSPLECAAIEY